METPPTNPSVDDQGRRPPPPTQVPGKSGNSGWIIAVVLLCVMVVGICPCLGIMTAMLLPAVQSARNAARTMESSNNLKQIGLALHNYHTVHGSFPPAYSVDNNGEPLHSWRTMILPYLEQQSLSDMVDYDAPWDDPVNLSMIDIEMAVYHSPRDPMNGLGMTNYVAIVGTQPGSRTILTGPEASRIDDVRDGTSNTIMVVEILNSDIPWFEPRDLDLDTYQRVAEGADPTTTNVIPRQAVMGFADGSVQRVGESMTAEMLRGYLTRDGGEPLEEFYEY